MTDPHEKDERLRNRIREAVRHLNGFSTGLQSDEDIAAQLDVVTAVPLEEDEVERIMNKVNDDLSLSVDQEDVQMQKRHISGTRTRSGGSLHGGPMPHSTGSSSLVVVVATSACLLAAVGLMQVAPQGETQMADTPTEPVRRLVARTSESETEGRLTAYRRAAELPAGSMQLGEALSTGERERRRVRLADGSILFVNEQTSVTLVADRRLKLTRGDVFVEVVPAELADGDRFVIETPSRAVTALGTKFAVSAAEKETNVLVTQGKVRVSGVAPVLGAGQEITVDERVQPLPPDGGIVAAPRASEALSWTRELMAAAAPVLVPKSDHAGGSIIVVDPDGQEMRLSLRRFHVDVHIQDGFARTTIDQTYFNHTFSRQEGTFHFPLPPDASLSRLAMYVNGKLMEGGMAERQHARNVYEQIRHTRRDPALLEWVDGSTFKMRVFPLEARQEKRIVLSYTQRLPNDYDRTVYRFPAGHSMEQVKDWTARVQVDGAAAKDTKQSWFSPSHLLKPTEEGDDLVLEGELHNAALDKDLVVELKPPKAAARRGRRPPVRVSSMQHEGWQYLMLRYRPDLTGDLDRPQRNWVFLFESSGDRDPLLARVQIDAIRTLLDNAEHDDTFSIVRAATRAEAFRDKPVRCSAKNIARAVTFLEEAHLVGALDLEKALKRCDDFCDDAGESWVVHVGSATPSVGERDAKKLLKRIPDDTRYVGIGVGKRWDRAFMKAAAAKSGGHFTQINPDEKVAWRAFELLSTLNAPRLLGIDVASERKNVRWLSFAETIAHGQEIAAVTRLPMTGKLPESVTVRGQLDSDVFEQTIDIDDVHSNAGYLPRIWARQEIDRLVAAGAEKNKAKIIVLSKAMYVMSPFTSLLVLEDEAMYEQFAIDRGRKDHWALYPAPPQIDVVHEPNLAAYEKLDTLESINEALKRQRARVDLAEANLQLSRREERIEEIRHLTERVDEELRKVEDLSLQAEELQELVEGEVVQKMSSVIVREKGGDVLKRLAEPVNDYFHWGFIPPNHANLWTVDAFNRQRLLSRSGRDAALAKFDADFNGNATWGAGGFGGHVNRRFFEDLRWNGAVDSDGDGSDVWFLGSRLAARNNALVGISNDGRGLTSTQWMDSGLWEASRETTVLNRLLVNPSDLLGPGPLGETLGISLEDRISRFEFAGRMTERARSMSGLTDEFLVSGVDSFGWRQRGLGLRPEFVDYGLVTSLGTIAPRHAVDPFTLGLPAELTDSVRLLTTTVDESASMVQLRDLTSMSLFDVDIDGEMDFILPIRPQIQFTDELSLVVTQQQAIERQVLARDFLLTDLTTPPNQMEVFNFSQIEPVRQRLAELKFTQPTVRYLNSPNGEVIPVLFRPTGIVRDPVSYAPGMESSTADLLAVLESEATETISTKRGQVDRGARRLIERARKRGWESVTIPGRSEDAGVTVLLNGAGQYSYERQLHEGLIERVVCDGESLWHLYPDLAIGAQRNTSRFHRQALQRLIPWFVAPADDLAVGANVEFVDRYTVRIIPIRDEQTDEESKKSKQSELVIELVFDKESRLVERRVVNLSDKGRVLRRVAFKPDGTVTVSAGSKGKSQSVKLARSLADAPELVAETVGLVVLPLPYRSVESYAVADSNGADSASTFSEEYAMKLIATHFANRDHASMWRIIKQRFSDDGDARIGFATLLASAGPQDTAAIQEIVSQTVVVDGEDSGETRSGTPATLGNILEQWCLWNRNRDLNVEFVVPEQTSPFLQKLARAHNTYARWASGRAIQDRTPGQIRTEFRRAMAFIRELQTPGLAMQLLSVIDHRFQKNSVKDAAYYDPLAQEASRLEKSAGVAGAARLARIQWLLVAGRKDEARDLYAEFLDHSASFGLAPRLDVTLHDSFAEKFGDSSAWRKLVRQAGRKLAEKERPIQLIALAAQCVRNDESDLGRSLFESAVDDLDLNARPIVAWLGLTYATQAGEWTEAETCLQALLQDDRRSRQAPLWRRASEVAASLGDDDESLRRLEQALELEFAELPDMINIESLRQQYGAVLARLEEMAQERIIAEETLPEDFHMRVIRLADRWRSVDPEATGACQAAARILDVIGQHGLAWDYWTTPLATTPNDSSAWTALARALRDRSRIVESDQAFAEAYACEQTNPEILIEHADMLLLDGQRKKAMSLYGQISDGSWQPRFSAVKSRATAVVNGAKPDSDEPPSGPGNEDDQ